MALTILFGFILGGGSHPGSIGELSFQLHYFFSYNYNLFFPPLVGDCWAVPGTMLSTPCDTQLCSVGLVLRHYSNMATISPVGLPRLSVWGWVSVGDCVEGLAYVFDHLLGESGENLLFWIRDRFAVRAPAFAWDQPKFDPWNHSWVQYGDPWALSGGAQWAFRKPQHHMI